MSDPSALPALFLAHGSPMLAIEGGAWAARLAALAGELPPVRGLVVCSAHWETPGGFRVTSGARPRTLHDFGGFPEVLYGLQYPAPGDPVLAARVCGLLEGAGQAVQADPDRGLDHGAWVPLRHLYPEAGMPVVQLSLPRPRDPRMLWAAGQALAPLRAEGILVVGSGGLVHNLGRLDWRGASGPEPWAEAFEGWLLDRLGSDQPMAAAAWGEAPGAALAVPTSEHLDPLWLAMGAAGGLGLETLHAGWQLGSLSLRCLAFGGGLSRRGA